MAMLPGERGVAINGVFAAPWFMSPCGKGPRPALLLALLPSFRIEEHRLLLTTASRMPCLVTKSWRVKAHGFAYQESFWDYLASTAASTRRIACSASPTVSSPAGM